MKRWQMLLMIGITVLALAACEATPTATPAQSGNESTAPTATAKSADNESPAATKEPTAQSTEKPSGPMAAGQSAKVGDAEVTFNAARLLTSDFMQPKAGYQHLAADFKVVNTGDNEYTLSTILQFEILDSDARKYNITIHPDQNGSLDGTIPVGSSVAGEVVFEVPVDKAPYTVRFTQSFGTQLAEWTVSQP